MRQGFSDLGHRFFEVSVVSCEKIETYDSNRQTVPTGTLRHLLCVRALQRSGTLHHWHGWGNPFTRIEGTGSKQQPSSAGFFPPFRRHPFGIGLQTPAGSTRRSFGRIHHQTEQPRARHLGVPTGNI